MKIEATGGVELHTLDLGEPFKFGSQSHVFTRVRSKVEVRL